MMMNNIILLVFILIMISVMFLVVFSLENLKINKEITSNLKNNEAVLSGNGFLLIILIGLFNIGLFNLLKNELELSKAVSYLITIFGGNGLIGLIGILPILSFSESRAEKITSFMKPFILIISFILTPLTFVYVMLKKLFYKPSNVKMTEDEFLDIIDKAELEDGINESEKDLIKSVLDFDNMKVLDIYTPRTDIVAIEDDMTKNEITKVFKTSGLSRLPIYTKSIDNIIGTINHKDFYNEVLLGKLELATIIQRPVEVPEYMAAKNLLSLLKTNKSHIAIVKDEYGGTLGIVTMEDILEELVGDIFDEHDKVSVNIRKLNDHKYIVSGSAYIDELNEYIDEINLDELEDEDYSTVNGWTLSNLGKMGKPGDTFTYNNISVLVTKANNKMVLEVELTILLHVLED